MKKKLCLILSLLLLFVLAAGCGTSNTPSISNKSNESGGVPRKQAEADVLNSTARDVVITSCSHDVDKTLHTDTVTLNYYYSQKYLKTTYTRSAKYQYNKSTDIWTLLPSTVTVNKDYELSSSLVGERWRGMTDLGLATMSYDITVKEINTINGWIHFTYKFVLGENTYEGEEYLDYGETVTHVEGLFRVSFNPDEGFKASR